MAADGSLIGEVNARISAAWLKWRNVADVICDRKISDRLRSKVYRSVIRPVAMYGSECWAITKDAEKRLSVMETKMLRRLAVVSLLDHIRNDDLRQKYGVAPIVDKL